MRKESRIFLFLSYVFLSCPLISFTQNEALDSIINANDIREIVKYLASDSMKGRMSGSSEMRMAADYIASEFKKAGAKPIAGNDGYFMNFNFLRRGGGTAYNVVAGLPGKSRKEETVIFSAHYDHVGTVTTSSLIPFTPQKPTGRDTIYNGANDNASGVAALISLARFYGMLNNNERSIVFVAFGAEELGLVGSNIMAGGVERPELISCVVNFDMVGRGSFPFITGSNFGDLRDILNNTLRKTDQKRFKKNYFGWDRYDEKSLFQRSDNIPFARLNIPAHTIMTTTDDDAYYHSVDDEPSTLNYALIREVCHAVVLGMIPIINGELSPRRIYIRNKPKS